MERCSIIVGTRDRFSTLSGCLRAIAAHTREPHDLIVLAGGAPGAPASPCLPAGPHPRALRGPPELAHQ